MPVKKTTRVDARVEKTVRLKKPVDAKKVTSAIGPKATLIVAGCVMAGGILIAARQQSPQVLTTTPRQEVALMPEARAKSLTPSNPSPAMPASGAASAPKAAPVTITGCLERDGDGFRLKDTSGTDAPRSRSWKSGFLKKGSAAIDVVDAVHTLKLTDQIGQRVSVTGTLVDREIQARAVRRIAASCSDH
jgi:hypothetical protein